MDERRRNGWWNMACWGALSPEQQRRLIEVGNLPIDYAPEGPCPNPATVAIETEEDAAGGPRFYCRPCAITYLSAHGGHQRAREQGMARQCYYIPPDAFVEGRGFIPSIVTENEPGHAPLTGNGRHAAPWYWGPGYDEAEAVAERCNREDFGLTPDEVVQIIASSMGASCRT